jgi:epoxide hydrolase-like predicted phosphatase
MRTDEWRAYVDQRAAKDERLMAYILDLRQRGYKTALLSNVGSQSLERRFSETELLNRFDAVIASFAVGVAKPNPEIYLHTAEKLDVKPGECVFTDDREEHCTGAEAVGMRAILYQDLAQFRRELEKILGDKK